MASTGERWQLGHRPALDGVRGIAVLLVIGAHAGVPLLANSGAVGVNIFFLLSGFLISSLLLSELASSGRIDVVDFYRRRALRLLPALFALVPIVWAFGYVARLGDWWATPKQVAGALFYYMNFLAQDGDGGALAHTWSLSLEEQFYVTWPLALLLLYRFRSTRAVLAGSLLLGAASFALSIALIDQGVSFRSDTRSFHLLFGCALAAALPLTPRLVRHARRRAVPVVGLAILLVVSCLGQPFATYGAGASIVLGSCLLVGAAATRDRIAWLQWGWLRWVGRRSYGIYLWHYPVSLLLPTFTPDWRMRLVVVLACSLLLAAGSWRYVETPFLRMKHSERKKTPALAEAKTGVSAVVAVR